ncbi:hypothetical protein ES703_86629 [subsurface metagenome]
MQINIFNNPAVIRVEVSVIPLIPLAGELLSVRPRIIYAHGQHIYNRCKFHKFGDIETKCHNPVIAPADKLSIKVELPSLPDTLEL